MPISLSTFFGPGGRHVQRGEEVADDDPILDGRAHLFDAPATPRKPAKKAATKKSTAKKSTAKK